VDPALSDALSAWRTAGVLVELRKESTGIQRAWDEPVCAYIASFAILNVDDTSKARFLAVDSAHLSFVKTHACAGHR